MRAVRSPRPKGSLLMRRKIDRLQRDDRRLRPRISTCCARSSTSYGGRIGSLVRGDRTSGASGSILMLRGTMLFLGEHVSRSGEHDPDVQGKRWGSTAKSILSGYWFEVRGGGIGIPSGSGRDLVGDGKRVARQGERCAWTTGANGLCEGIDPDGPLGSQGSSKRRIRWQRAIRPVRWFDDRNLKGSLGRARRAAIRTVHMVRSSPATEADRSWREAVSRSGPPVTAASR